MVKGDDDENTEHLVVKASCDGVLPRIHLYDSRIFCCVLLCILIRTRIPDAGFQHPPCLVGMFSFGNVGSLVLMFSFGNDEALVVIGGAVEETMILGPT